MEIALKDKGASCERTLFTACFTNSIIQYSCDTAPIGVSVTIKNSSAQAQTLQFYVARNTTLDPISVNTNSTLEVFIPADKINSSIKEQGFFEGNLVLKSSSTSVECGICGYIEFASNEICAQSHFEVTIN